MSNTLRSFFTFSPAAVTLPLPPSAFLLPPAAAAGFLAAGLSAAAAAAARFLLPLPGFVLPPDSGSCWAEGGVGVGCGEGCLAAKHRPNWLATN